MKLWNQVCETNPDTTKQVNQRGGFTAIDAQSQRKRATEVFGAYGIGWALTDFFWSTITDNGKIVEITLDATFVYPDGKFPISSDIAYRPGGECRKKLITDCTTKALSFLGFNSDIFEGKFEDLRYQLEMKQKFAAPVKPKIPADKSKYVERARGIYNNLCDLKLVTQKQTLFMSRIDTRTLPEIKGFLTSADKLLNK